ncbi:glucosidase family protein [Cohnella rhizosphaerae]|uniref:Alpha-L-rhamnosidase six-hairpin glycosidase domain-containing protein n=1 Tax=Cohnella rhizosphaerae TaxID=1457232 RepID=A0A9X4KPZ3_9BACL|nr:hypothetical protein [Cohnella rhizosphaerae]MDG0808637.1 hypothetical protein [Cohnella rhizosphaerae]
MTAAYTVDRGVILSECGLPESPRWFSDGRLSFQMDDRGITQVDYCHPAQRFGNTTLFLQRHWHGFRLFIERDLRNYLPELRQVRVWPFGIEAEWRLFDSLLGLRVMAVEERIVFELRTPEGLPEDLTLKLAFYKHFALTPSDAEDPRFAPRGARRTWDDWRFDDAKNAFIGGFSERPHDSASLEEHRGESRQQVSIEADFPLRVAATPVNVKYTLSGAQPLQAGRTYRFAISLGDESALDAASDEAIGRQFARYRAVADASPVLDSPYPALNEYMSLLPMYHEACKVRSVPGAIKAKTNEYWVWGWDGLTSNDATMYWGDAAFIADMLRFYEETADPERGIAHAYGYDLSVIGVSALPAQGMYITLLQQYYAMTGDLDVVARHYPFAAGLYRRIAALEVGDTGLCEGTSLFPDFPVFMQETGRDLSGMNNTIFYCASRSMEYLAALTGDEPTETLAGALFRRTERHFLPLFFDPSRGFIVSSVDADSLARRNSFNANAVKWENGYCRELLAGAHERSLQFFLDHIVSPSGLREIPPWDGAYDRDANQLQCWWPVTGEYFMRLINAFDRREPIDRWIGWVEYWARRLTCPEGIPLYVETTEPELDRWNSLKGSWQAYSMRGWYQAAVHGVVGVDIDAGGIQIHPYSGEELTLRGLHYRGKRLHLEMRGSGPYVEYVDVGDTRIEGTCKIPSDLLNGADELTIRVRRTAQPLHSLYIARATGLALREYAYGPSYLSAVVSGAGTARLTVLSDAAPDVCVDDREASCEYDSGSRTATIELRCKPGEPRTIHISRPPEGGASPIGPAMRLTNQ